MGQGGPLRYDHDDRPVQKMNRKVSKSGYLTDVLVKKLEPNGVTIRPCIRKDFLTCFRCKCSWYNATSAWFDFEAPKRFAALGTGVRKRSTAGKLTCGFGEGVRRDDTLCLSGSPFGVKGFGVGSWGFRRRSKRGASSESAVQNGGGQLGSFNATPLGIQSHEGQSAKTSAALAVKTICSLLKKVSPKA